MHRICAVPDRWRKGGPSGPGWPYWATRAQWRHGAPSWCYGAAGVPRVHQLAGFASGNTDRQAVAESAFVWALPDSGRAAQAEDCTLCHGYAGLLPITSRAAADTTTTDLSQRWVPIAAVIRSGCTIDIHLVRQAVPVAAGHRRTGLWPHRCLGPLESGCGR